LIVLIINSRIIVCGYFFCGWDGAGNAPSCLIIPTVSR